jgi:hypothetical protein
MRAGLGDLPRLSAKSSAPLNWPRNLRPLIIETTLSLDACAYAGVARTRGQDIRTSRQWRRQVTLVSHKYKVGQSVRYNSGAARRAGSNASFKIVRLLPSEGDHQQYRIKSASEAHERLAKENELNLDF